MCGDAWAVLVTEQRRFGFPLQRVDVDSDPALAERYGLDVPVVVVDGQVRFRGRVSPALFRRLLRGHQAL